MILAALRHGTLARGLFAYQSIVVGRYYLGTVHKSIDNGKNSRTHVLLTVVHFQNI